MEGKKIISELVLSEDNLEDNDPENEFEYNRVKKAKNSVVTSKICPNCNIEKSLDKFYVNERSNYSTYCKRCYKTNSEYFDGKIIDSKDKHKYLKRVVISYYSNGKNCCECCGENNIELLTLDHINNDGATHRKEIKSVYGGINFYKYLIKNNFPKYPPLQVLCYNCNFGKKLNIECPHKIVNNKHKLLLEGDV